MSDKKPMVLVIAGPNGSGKSTISEYFDKVGTYTNADEYVASTGVSNEEGRYDKETARQLLCACRKGVHWCDGNEEEAIEDVIDAGYCGLCMTKKEKISNIYDNDLKYPDNYKVFNFLRNFKKQVHFYLPHLYSAFPGRAECESERWSHFCFKRIISSAKYIAF